MSRIWELNEKQQDLLDQLSWLDEESEDYAELETKLMMIRGDAENTLKFLSTIFLQLDYDESEAVDEENRIKAVLDKAKKRTARISKEKARLESVMVRISKEFEIPQFKTGYGVFKRKITPGALVYDSSFDVENLADDFVRVIPEKREPDGKAILEVLRSAIKDEKGKLDPFVTYVAEEEFPGVALVRKEGFGI
jgi:hypothetical protein